MQKPVDVLVFSHTHWDREWYRTFQEFRFSLIDVIDQILNLVQAQEYNYFILDGQTIVLEDYLEIRPELKETLAKRIKSGKLIIGPWYILPDEFLVSGESLVRNLLIGEKISLDFGKAQSIGYLPDMFGHIAQIPQILKGFKIEKAIVWRGVIPNKNLFIWKGLDGTETLTTHLTDGYYNTFLINYENQKNNLKEHLEKLKNSAYNNNLILFPNGGDHLAPIENINEILEKVNEEFSDFRFRQSTIEEYFNHLEYKKEDLEVLLGELKKTGEFTYILQGVLSARTYLKQYNFKIQNLISNWVEPLSTISWLVGNDYNEGFIDLVWKNLLKNQPHDSICGCSTDQVHKEMMIRYEETEQLCHRIINKNLFLISESLGLDEKYDYINLFNNTTSEISTVQTLELDFLENEKVESFKLVDILGEEIPYELISKTNLKKFISDIDVLPDWIKVDRFKITLKVDDIKALGNKSIKILKNEKPNISINSDIKSTENKVENNFFTLEIKDESLILTNKETKKEYLVNNFYTSGDAGDEYNYSPPKTDYLRFAVIKSFETISKNNLAIELKVEYELEYFEKLAENREENNGKKVTNFITSFITIKSFDPILYFKTEVLNNSMDHRLRVSFGTDEKEALKCLYDTHFGILEQTLEINKRPWDQPKKFERQEETFAIQKFADLSNSLAGFTVINKGLPEFEITDLKSNKELSFTLIRGVGWLSRDDLRTRGGGAGPAFETPDAQCLGKQSFEYAIYSHDKDLYNSKALQKADEYLIGIKYIQYKSKNQTKISIKNSLFELIGDNLVLSAIKRAENKTGVIIRFYNPNNKALDYKIKPSDSLHFKKVQKVLLNESVEKDLISKNSFYQDTINPFEIVTLCFNL
ncbi:MAG: glycoside hydrolase family 38 C-terminal domain-containing protein [Candidatus Sericytochromatia bacterium]